MEGERLGHRRAASIEVGASVVAELARAALCVAARPAIVLPSVDRMRRLEAADLHPDANSRPVDELTSAVIDIRA